MEWLAQCVTLSILLTGAFAQSDASTYAALSNIPPPAEGVEAQFWFPEHTSLQFPAGDTIEAVVGLHSGGSDSYNITAIFGSLNNPTQFSQHFFNFTPQGYQRTLRAGEEVSLSYSLYVPYNLPAREFQVALTVFYAAEGGANYYANTFFNRTIDIVETPKWVDTELLFLWLLLLAAVSVGGYFAYGYVVSLGYFRKQKTKRTPRRPAQNRDISPDRSGGENEWLKGTNFSASPKPPRKQASNKDLRKQQLLNAAAVPTQ